jgi:sialic acid synthase SpsE
MHTEIVAELAQGFEGSVKQAKLLVRAASKAGADAAKFQLVYADELATPDYPYYELFSGLEMTDEEWLSVKASCDANGIELILDVFGDLGLALAEKLSVKTIKLHATDINNVGFLNALAKSSIERIMLGAGGAYLEEIKYALEILDSKKVVLFHGFQGYPTAINDNQISRLKVLELTFSDYRNVVLGFSDHVDPTNPSSITLPAYAVGQGVMVLEKHLTLGCCMELEDHESAMNPDQFKIFVDCIRNIEIAHGESSCTNNFGMSESEEQYRKNIRRHVIAAKELKVGDVIKASDVALKRSSLLSAYTDIQFVYGKTLNKVINKNTPLSHGDVNE